MIRAHDTAETRAEQTVRLPCSQSKGSAMRSRPLIEDPQFAGILPSASPACGSELLASTSELTASGTGDDPGRSLRCPLDASASLPLGNLVQLWVNRADPRLDCVCSARLHSANSASGRSILFGTVCAKEQTSSRGRYLVPARQTGFAAEPVDSMDTRPFAVRADGVRGSGGTYVVQI